MPKPKYTLVEMQTASKGSLQDWTRLNKVSNLEGIVKGIDNWEKKRDTNTEIEHTRTVEHYKRCNIHAVEH